MWDNFLERGSNLLGPEHAFGLQERPDPNLYREYFPYTEVPKMPFHGRVLPLNPPKEIWITDTTFRDGQQARPPYTVKQIVTIFEFLHRLAGDRGVVRQSEFFLYNERDRQAVKGLDQLVPEHVVRSTQFTLALKDALEESRPAAVAVRCWPELFVEYKAAACSTLSHLIEDGVQAACEADTLSLLTTFLLERAVRAPVMMVAAAPARPMVMASAGTVGGGGSRSIPSPAHSERRAILARASSPARRPSQNG